MPIRDKLLAALDELQRADEERSEDTKLLDQVEALCTREKSFSYWASVAFGVKPRDVLRNILHEAQRQKDEAGGRTDQWPSEGEPSPSESTGGSSRGE